MRWPDGVINSMDMSLSRLWEIVKNRKGSLVCCSPWGHRDGHDWAAIYGVAQSRTRLKRLSGSGSGATEQQ